MAFRTVLNISPSENDLASDAYYQRALDLADQFPLGALDSVSETLIKSTRKDGYVPPELSSRQEDVAQAVLRSPNLLQQLLDETGTGTRANSVNFLNSRGYFDSLPSKDRTDIAKAQAYAISEADPDFVAQHPEMFKTAMETLVSQGKENAALATMQLDNLKRMFAERGMVFPWSEIKDGKLIDVPPPPPDPRADNAAFVAALQKTGLDWKAEDNTSAAGTATLSLTGLQKRGVPSDAIQDVVRTTILHGNTTIAIDDEHPENSKLIVVRQGFMQRLAAEKPEQQPAVLKEIGQGLKGLTEAATLPTSAAKLDHRAMLNNMEPVTERAESAPAVTVVAAAPKSMRFNPMAMA